MIGWYRQTNGDKFSIMALLAVAVVAVIFLGAAEAAAVSCDDCDAHCGADCDCLSCLPALHVALGPTCDLTMINQLISRHTPSGDVHPDPARVSGIDHPPQLSA